MTLNVFKAQSIYFQAEGRSLPCQEQQIVTRPGFTPYSNDHRQRTSLCVRHLCQSGSPQTSTTDTPTGVMKMTSTLFGQRNAEPLSPDDLYLWRVSGLLDLRSVITASSLHDQPRPLLIRKIVRDEAFRAHCIEVIKTLDFAQWSANRRDQLAQRACEYIRSALADGRVYVTNSKLSEPMDPTSVAVDEGISAEEINAILPLQSAREAMYDIKDRYADLNVEAARRCLGSILRD